MGETEQVLSAERVGEVQDLKPVDSGAIALTPDTIVLCRNRGRETYVDKFDSRDYQIGPGSFTAPYGAALHFKRRAVVPGSRNPETGFQASFITIIGVVHPKPGGGLKVVRPIDDAVEWDPFTDDECREYGHAVEALDRASMVDPIDSDVTLVPTRGQANEDAKEKAASRIRQGGGAGRGKGTRIEGSGKDQLRPGRTDDNEATRSIRSANAAVQAGRTDDDAPQAPDR